MLKIKKSVYLVIILLLGVIGFTTYAVTAWLTDTDTTGPSTFTVGDVEYTWGGALTSSTAVVPGEELVTTTFTLTNSSTVSSELRFKITAVVDYPSANTDALDKLLITLGSNWVKDGDYYYYKVGDPADPVIVAGTQVLNVITNLKLDGSKVGNAYTGATFSITLMFEAKQAQYVTWTQLGTAGINFSTGLA